MAFRESYVIYVRCYFIRGIHSTFQLSFVKYWINSGQRNLREKKWQSAGSNCTFLYCWWLFEKVAKHLLAAFSNQSLGGTQSDTNSVISYCVVCEEWNKLLAILCLIFSNMSLPIQYRSARIEAIRIFFDKSIASAEKGRALFLESVWDGSLFSNW